MTTQNVFETAFAGKRKGLNNDILLPGLLGHDRHSFSIYCSH